MIERDGLDASMFSALLLVDAQGRVVSNSAGVDGANLSAIDTFIAHRDDPSPRLRIGTPRKGVISGSYTLPISRRLSLADGTFGGLVSAGLKVEYLSAFYDLVDLGPSGLVLLAQLDGTLLARRTPQLRDRLEASETAADDDDLVFSGARGAHSAHYFRCTSSVVWLPASAA